MPNCDWSVNPFGLGQGDGRASLGSELAEFELLVLV